MTDLPIADLGHLMQQAAVVEERPLSGPPGRGSCAVQPPGGPEAPSLAMGLNGIADWTNEHPFVDLMKTARPWTGHLPGQWGGWDHAALAAAGALDEAGWPRFIPKALTGISTLLLTEQPEAARSLAGRYRLTYRGVGQIGLDGRVSNVVQRPGEIWFDYTPGSGMVLLTITASDPANSGDHLRDIQVVKAENIDLLEVGALFNPDWLAHVEHLRAIRFMDWMATNDSPLSEWSDRPRPADYTFAWRGVPVEVMVELSNEIAADPWFTLPHQATDGYVRAFADYVREHLNPDRRTYAEYSNEVWNWIFGQTHWAQAEAAKRWGAAAGGDAWVQFAGMRAAQTAAIWDDAFGPEADDRLVNVISPQTGWPALAQPLLEAPLWVAEDPAQNRPPASYFDAYAVTGYFGHQLGGEKAGDVLAWLAESRDAAEAAARSQGLDGPALAAEIDRHRFDLATERAAAELRDGAVTGRPDDSLAALGELWATHADAAARHHLALLMYEGGTHVVASPEWRENVELTDFLSHLNYTPQMAGLYETLLDDWRRVGGGPFNAFVDVAGASKWGSWGALRYLEDDNPRWDVLMTFNRDVPAWWEQRPATAFANGVVRRGTSAADEIHGTVCADTLLGGPGDDILHSQGGTDRLHGGPGTDAAVLPGRRDDYRLKREGAAILAEGPEGVTVRLVSVESVRFTDDTISVAIESLP